MGQNGSLAYERSRAAVSLGFLNGSERERMVTNKHQWRRGRDSNPRSPARGTTVFETAPFDRSGTSPHKRRQRLSTTLRRDKPRIGTRLALEPRLVSLSPIAASIARAGARPHRKGRRVP